MPDPRSLEGKGEEGAGEGGRGTWGGRAAGAGGRRGRGCGKLDYGLVSADFCGRIYHFPLPPHSPPHTPRLALFPRPPYPPPSSPQHLEQGLGGGATGKCHPHPP